MRFAEEHDDDSSGILFTNATDALGGVFVAARDLAQIVARTAIQGVNTVTIGAGGFEKAIEGKPVVAPVCIVAQAFAQFGAVDFA